MGSTRLPGKVLQDIGGEPMLARVVHRTQRARLLSQVIVATTTASRDESIVAECERLGIPVFRGSEQDVLDRYYRAAQAHQADVIARVTSDCPLVDPAVADRIIQAFLDTQPDYASNALKRTYPRGLEVEVASIAALERAWREARESYQRVHVMPYLYQNPDLFRLLSVTIETDYSHYRWTVDTPEDLAFVQAVYERLGNDAAISWTDVLALLEREPDLAKLNRHIQQKAIHAG
jgi:spore coat polysaccharide biosynthesis protein SpsF